MKKAFVIAIVLVLALSFSLTACAVEEAEDIEEPTAELNESAPAGTGNIGRVRTTSGGGTSG